MMTSDSQEFQPMKIDKDEKLKRKQAKLDLRFALANGLNLPLKSKGRVTMQRREEEEAEHERLYDAWRKKRTDAGLPISGDIIAKRTSGKVNALIKDVRVNGHFVEMKPSVPPKESRNTIKEKMGEIVTEVTESMQSSVIKEKTDEIMATVNTPVTKREEKGAALRKSSHAVDHTKNKTPHEVDMDLAKATLNEVTIARDVPEVKSTIKKPSGIPQNTLGIVFEQVPAYKCS